MRRPTLCCDNQPSADVDTPCKDQGGAFSRMRRLFLMKPLGRRSVASVTSKSPCRAAGSVVSRCDLSRGSSSSSNTTSSSAPPLLLHQSFVSIEQEVLGMELEAAVTHSKSHQGIPALVYQLCSYILNHDVDSSALVFEEWCSRDVKDVLTRHPRCSSLDACNVAPLLRLFIERLPKPLISPATSAALVAIASDAASTQGRQLLLREVPASNLRLLRYLTAFLSCLSHSNRCEGGQAWVLLAAGVTGRCCAGDNRLLGKTVAEYLLLNNLSLFPEERLSLPPTLASDDLANSSDTSLTVLTSQEEEEEEEQDSSGGGVVSSTNDDEDDRMSSSSSSTSSRSCTTTSEDTEGFRSPQLAMGEVSGRYRTMEELVSPDMDQLEQFSTGLGHEVSSRYPKADELTTTVSGKTQEPQKQSDTVTTSDSLLSASDSANTDEPDEERKGTTTSFDLETGRKGRVVGLPKDKEDGQLLGYSTGLKSTAAFRITSSAIVPRSMAIEGVHSSGCPDCIGTPASGSGWERGQRRRYSSVPRTASCPLYELQRRVFMTQVVTEGYGENIHVGKTEVQLTLIKKKEQRCIIGTEQDSSLSLCELSVKKLSKISICVDYTILATVQGANCERVSSSTCSILLEGLTVSFTCVMIKRTIGKR
ncbi:Rho GTPase-activating protein domain [Trinorchestia longiramus]|nr:Rho GTPase-activating protein domain [Trinorchestia longiramus]